MESAFLDLLRKRRSIRQFQPRAVESSKIDALIEEFNARTGLLKAM